MSMVLNRTCSESSTLHCRAGGTPLDSHGVLGSLLVLGVSGSQEEKTQQHSLPWGLGPLETSVSLQRNMHMGDPRDEAMPTTLTIYTNLGAIFSWPWLLPDGFHIQQKQNPGFWFYQLR